MPNIPEAIMTRIYQAVAHARPEVDVIYALVPESVAEQTVIVGRMVVTLTHRQFDVVPDWRTIGMSPMSPERVLWVVERLSRYQRGTLLDVGCGLGQIAGALMDDGWKVQAFDIAPHSVQAACVLGVDATVCAIADWDWSGHWDVVLSTAVLEHLPREQHAIIPQIRQAAGRLCVVTDTETVSSLHTQPDLVKLLGESDECVPAETWPGNYRWMAWISPGDA